MARFSGVSEKIVAFFIFYLRFEIYGVQLSKWILVFREKAGSA
jgi:hypothetical protein